MGNYLRMQIADMVGVMSVEIGHTDSLVDAMDMWTALGPWVELTHQRLELMVEGLLGSNGWVDDGAKEFRALVEPDLKALRSWMEKLGSSSPGAGGTAERPAMSAVASTMESTYGGLVQQIGSMHERMQSYSDALGHMPGSAEDDKVAEQYRQDAARDMETLGASFTIVAGSVERLKGQPWTGPQAALPAAPNPQGTPGPATTNSGDPKSTGGDPGEPATPDPGDIEPEQPGDNPTQPSTTEDPLKTILEKTPDVLNALSSAVQSAQQLLAAATGSGSGTGGIEPLVPNIPDPIARLDPKDLSSLINPRTPLDFPDREPYEAAGLPGLAGGDLSGGGLGGASGLGGGGGAVGGIGVPAVPPGVSALPSAGAVGAALPSGTTGTAGRTSSATGSSSGGVPPMYPPPMANNGGKGAGGIKPGAAENPVSTGTGRPRGRKPAITPGVALPGRSGGGQQGPVSRRRWDTENNSLQLLDEELWQVERREGST